MQKYTTDPRPVRFFIAGNAVPKQSFMITSKNATKTKIAPPRVQVWQKEVAGVAYAEMVRIEHPRPHEGLFEVFLRFILPDRRTRDLDNLSKGVLDGLRNVVFQDDRFVKILHISAELETAEEGAGVYVTVMRIADQSAYEMWNLPYPSDL